MQRPGVQFKVRHADSLPHSARGAVGRCHGVQLLTVPRLLYRHIAVQTLHSGNMCLVVVATTIAIQIADQVRLAERMYPPSLASILFSPVKSKGVIQSSLEAT